MGQRFPGFSDSNSRPTVTLQSCSATGPKDAVRFQINFMELCYKIAESRDSRARDCERNADAHAASGSIVWVFVFKGSFSHRGRKRSGFVGKITQNIVKRTAGEQLMTLRLVRCRSFHNLWSVFRLLYVLIFHFFLPCRLRLLFFLGFSNPHHHHLHPKSLKCENAEMLFIMRTNVYGLYV